jgi:hypothetical protein
MDENLDRKKLEFTNKKKKKNSRPHGPGMNEVSFRARPHHNMHCTSQITLMSDTRKPSIENRFIEVIW